MDKYEKEILDSFQRDEWRPVKSKSTKQKAYAKYAKHTFLKNKRINIRLSDKDLDSLKMYSMEQGLPYQTLIASILHKYVNGKLVEREDVED